MRNLFFAIVFTVASVCSVASPAFAGATGNPDCNSLINASCKAVHTPGTGLKPSVPGQVCFVFTQKHSDFVVLSMYDVIGNPDDLNDPSNHVFREVHHLKPDGIAGRFCIGPSDVRKAVLVVLCNQDDAHSIRDTPYLQEGLKTGTVKMCLNGDSSCAAFVN